MLQTNFQRKFQSVVSHKVLAFFYEYMICTCTYQYIHHNNLIKSFEIV